jgi:hypothetical protein
LPKEGTPCPKVTLLFFEAHKEGMLG